MKHKNSTGVPVDTGSQVTVEFHVSSRARKKFDFDEHLFSASGNVVFADFRAARIFAKKMNELRDLHTRPELTVKAGHISAMGLIDEVLHIVIELYRQKVNTKVMDQALAWLRENLGADALQETMQLFVKQFPPAAVYTGKMDVDAYLKGSTNGVSNKESVIEELMMLWLSNRNKAFHPYQELFDDAELSSASAYQEAIESLQVFFATQPPFGPEQVDLFSLLRIPALKSPDSLEGQLNYILGHWTEMLKGILVRLLGGLDFMKEEAKAGFTGSAPTEALYFTGQQADEPERFTADLDWMPSLVLMAKSTLVWLDQLTKKYDRQISRLDEIPDEELDRLAGWGISGLWLIGIWERSPASKKIKQMCGNPEAEASAYSLFDYEIAQDLGGEDALNNLRQRCWQRRIRMGCDMVPNHTGIDSRWLREQPDWFISLPHSPFPNYRFGSANFSADPRYNICIEDGYFDRSDAAVVFRREDTWNGNVRYIYHGNDGTSMPWNDTAQLDYLNPEVREAVINKIVEVARKFPVIRFDAAMTLAKKHFHRLWYPEPGSGGDIPTRSEFGLSRQKFDEIVPAEFWREVVDRVAQEAPDTLLLAEAFWLMEGYFVRTLGMHRVYNSAFMHMLKNEENHKYRETVINTLQFNPEILKRYVNFMNNPDEDTAIAQFGDGDKYFGVCTMLATMPGLPMLGHGQIEGYHEKYGMEYRRAYFDEKENNWLVQRHEREIFPLFKKRYLFAGVENFIFYDFVNHIGEINDNVFAYSNAAFGDRALVLYNNKYEEAFGWIRTSVPFSQPSENGGTRLVQRSLGQGLGLTDDENYYFIFRDQVAGLEYMRNSRQVCDQGLYFELSAFKYLVVTEMSEVRDDDAHSYGELCIHLNGAGVVSISEAVAERRFSPFLVKLDDLFSSRVYSEFMELREKIKDETISKIWIQKWQNGYQEMDRASAELFGGPLEHITSDCAAARLEAALDFDESVAGLAKSRVRGSAGARRLLQTALKNADWSFIYACLVLRGLRPMQETAAVATGEMPWLCDRLIDQRFKRLRQDAGGESESLYDDVHLLAVLLGEGERLFMADMENLDGQKALNALFENPDVRSWVKVNEFEGVVWFNKERFNKMVIHLFLLTAISVFSRENTGHKQSRSVAAIMRDLVAAAQTVNQWFAAEEKSEYKLTELLRLCTGSLS